MPTVMTGRFSEVKVYKWQTLNPGWGGVNFSDLPFRMTDSQSPKMKNMWITGRTLACRTGQEWASDALADAIVSCHTKLFKGKMVVHSGTSLYAKGVTEQAFVKIYDGVTSPKGLFYEFGGKLYYKNRGSFVVYDGEAASSVEAYVPVVSINRKPDGSSGNTADSYNLMTGGFKNKFNGDGSTKIYKLTDDGLSDSAVAAVVGGVEMNEGSGFTVNRAEGTVTFTNAPAAGQNNVEITAYAAGAGIAEDFERIMNCNVIAAYGGANNSRLFLAGGGGGRYYYSDVLNPAYWPDTNYNVAFDGSEDVTAFAEQYDVLIGFTENKTFGVSYNLSESGTVTFPQSTINPDVGCDCPYSVSLVDNRLVWLTSGRGPMQLVSTDIENEKNVVPIGRNINGGYSKGLLSCNGLKEAIGMNVDGKYWLIMGSEAYVWDYGNYPYRYTGQLEKDARNLAWFYFDNVEASCYLKTDSVCYLCRGTRMVALVDNLMDFGEGIMKVYRTPFLDFGLIGYLKNVLRVWITTRTDTNSKISLRYISENEPEGDQETEEINAYSFNWSKTTWSLMTWAVLNFAKTYRRKCKKKKIQRFAIEMSNGTAGSDMNVAEIYIEYTISKMIKEG